MEKSQSDKIEEILEKSRSKPPRGLYDRPALLAFVIFIFGPAGFLLLLWIYFFRREIFNKLLSQLLVYLGLFEGIGYILFYGLFFLYVFPQLKSLFEETGENFGFSLGSILLLLIPFLLDIFAFAFGYYFKNRKKLLEENKGIYTLSVILLFSLFFIPALETLSLVQSIIMPIYNLANVIT